MFKLFILVFIFTFYMFTAVADSGVLNLKDVLKIAQENNPKLIAAREKLNQYEAQKFLAKSTLYPNLSWIIGGSYQKDASYTGSSKFGGNAYDVYSADLKLSQTLYGKGLLSAINLSEYDKKIQLANIEIEERNLTQNVIEAFFRFILNQEALENLLKNQEIIQKSLKTTTKRYESGRGQLLDILQVKTQLALIQPQVEQAKNQLMIAGQQLVNYMGEKDHEGLIVKGKLKSLLLRDVQRIIDINNLNFPEYHLNQLQLSQLDYNRDIILGKNFPTIKLVGDYLYTNYKKTEIFSENSRAWSIQVQLTIPLFSGFSSTHERSLLASQDTQLRIARKELENTLNLKEVTSLKNLQTSESSLISSESAVRLAEEAQAEGNRLYKLSQIDLLQFLSVQQNALQAKSSLNQLKFQSILAYVNYFVASGQSLTRLVDILVEG
ncbi:MAG: TolC family protein [Bacteriovorax sp.]|nr:TolC family protein [Bacteriovorax sp.]